MINRRHRLPVVQQCRVLGVARSSAYYVSQPVSAADLALMRLIDELHLQYPFAGTALSEVAGGFRYDLIRVQPGFF